MKEKDAFHSHAIVINMSGHRLPQSVFDSLKDKGHKTFSVFTRSVHIDVDGNIYEQCLDYVHQVLSVTDRQQQTILNLEGELYYVSAGHTQANLIIYGALESLLGHSPHLIVTGIDNHRFHSYSCKDIFNLKSWKGRWRSIERNKYIQALTEYA